MSRDVSGEGVQQALLKLLEGTVANIQVRGNKRLPNQEYVQVDTTNILFICGGSFEGIDRLIEDRMGRRRVGFVTDDDGKTEKEKNLLAQAKSEDLQTFGLIPEFIGRLPVLASLEPLSEDDLTHILKEPRNSLVRQYQKLFRFEKVKLTFTDEALRAVAEKAASRKAGARGLRTILENVMLDIMYEVPSCDDIKEVVITEEIIRQGLGDALEVAQALPASG